MASGFPQNEISRMLMGFNWIYVYMYTNINIYINMHICIYIYILYTYIFIYGQICIYTHISVSTQS